MGVITSLTRMWLTKTTRPFEFKNEYDEQIAYQQCERLGLYVHLPFCQQLCAFCPYCKVVYEEAICANYVNSLIREIHLVGQGQRRKKEVTSLYFGGGTPALAANRMGEIMEAIEEHFIVTEGIGVELHPDNVTVDTLRMLKKAGVTKISIGIQAFGKKYIALLGRREIEVEPLRQALAAVKFETVSMDFIFALPKQTVEDLQSEIETAFAVGANHIAIYPFIDFTFTDAKIPAMKAREKRHLLNGITEYCENMGYVRDSIWTFSKGGSSKYSSMTREHFLGFGCSATTLVMDQFKLNTFSVAEYGARIAEGKLATALTLRFTKRQRMMYYLFWTAYSTRVSRERFEQIFGISLQRAYGLEIWVAKKLGYITEAKGVLQMTRRGAFAFHYYEQFYTLSYIDRMWNVMRKEAFPKGISL